MSDNPVVDAAARRAAAERTRDPEKIAKAKQAVTEAKLRRAIEAAIAAAPPLTPDTRERLAHLLQTGGQ